MFLFLLAFLDSTCNAASHAPPPSRSPWPGEAHQWDQQEPSGEGLPPPARGFNDAHNKTGVRNNAIKMQALSVPAHTPEAAADGVSGMCYTCVRARACVCVCVCVLVCAYTHTGNV